MLAELHQRALMLGLEGILDIAIDSSLSLPLPPACGLSAAPQRRQLQTLGRQGIHDGKLGLIFGSDLNFGFQQFGAASLSMLNKVCCAQNCL